MRVLKLDSLETKREKADQIFLFNLLKLIHPDSLSAYVYVRQIFIPHHKNHSSFQGPISLGTSQGHALFKQ